MTIDEIPAVPTDLADAAAAIIERAPALAQAQTDYLADLIRLRSYTGEEGPAVERTLEEMNSGGFDDVRAASAGDALEWGLTDASRGIQ